MKTENRTSQKIIAVGLALMLLLTLIVPSQAFAQTRGAYANINVDTAYEMIKEEHSNLVILDVRNQSEYNVGHLYNALLIPLYEIEKRIDELRKYIHVLGVAATCLASAMMACLFAITIGVLGSWAALFGCWGYCPSMQSCITLSIWYLLYDLVCTNVW